MMKSSNVVRFRRGDKFEATIKSVRVEGVYIEMPGGVGKGVVSARCWGNGKKRKVAMAALKPGDKISVVVKWFHRQTKILNLVLPKDGTISNFAQAKVQEPHNVSRTIRPSRKPAYHPIASGTVLLIDTANLFGVIGHDNAAHNLECISCKLQEWGYDVVFFIERRTQTWCVCQQTTPSAAGDFMKFCANSHVTIVDGESDLAILQVARSMDNAVCCSRDRFKDYADSFSDIVNGPRKRSFSCAQVDQNKFLMIEGLPAAIMLEPPCDESVVVDPDSMAIADDEGCDTCAESMAEMPDWVTPPENKSVERCICRARSIIERGEVEHAIRYLGEIGKQKSEGYRTVADIMAAEFCGRANGEEEQKFLRLAERAERRMRELDRRDARIYAELMDKESTNGIRISSRKRMAMRIAASYAACAERRKTLNRHFGRAA